jgi:hypothetical protein
MNPELILTNPASVRLRRVGRFARRRMRIDGDALRNGRHTDGQLTVEISDLGAAAAGVPESFNWQADRPISLVIVRSGIDGGDVNFDVGPAIAGTGGSAGVGDGSGIRYVAFCYDAEIVTSRSVVSAAAPLAAESRRDRVAASVADSRGLAAGVSIPRAHPRFHVGPTLGRLARSGSPA